MAGMPPGQHKVLIELATLTIRSSPMRDVQQTVVFQSRSGDETQGVAT